MVIHQRDEAPEDMRVYWVVEIGNTVAEMHASHMQCESPVSPVLEFAAGLQVGLSI